MRFSKEHHSGSRSGPRDAAPAAPPSTAEVLFALRHDRLDVAHQPIVSLADGRLCGTESLVRWRHPVHGVLLPGAFLHLVRAASAMHAAGPAHAARRVPSPGRLGLRGPDQRQRVPLDAAAARVRPLGPAGPVRARRPRRPADARAVGGAHVGRPRAGPRRAGRAAPRRGPARAGRPGRRGHDAAARPHAGAGLRQGRPLARGGRAPLTGPAGRAPAARGPGPRTRGGRDRRGRRAPGGGRRGPRRGLPARPGVAVRAAGAAAGDR